METRTASESAREQTADDVERVVRAAFAAINDHDLETMSKYMHPDNENDIVAVGVKRGREEVLGFFRESFAAFPDMRFEVDRVLADDRIAFVQWRATGTFTGEPFQGIEATGSRIAHRGVDCVEIVDGKFKKNTIYYDGVTLGRAVGMLPPEGSAPDKAMLVAFNATTRIRRALRKRRNKT